MDPFIPNNRVVEANPIGVGQLPVAAITANSLSVQQMSIDFVHLELQVVNHPSRIVAQADIQRHRYDQHGKIFGRREHLNANVNGKAEIFLTHVNRANKMIDVFHVNGERIWAIEWLVRSYCTLIGRNHFSGAG